MRAVQQVLQHIKKLFDLLTPRERRQTVLLLGMFLIMGLLDAAGVASIMPFMAVLANPQLVQTNVILSFLYKELGFTDTQHFLFALGVMIFVVLVVSIAFKAATAYAQLRFVLMREYAIGRRLVAGYLHQPYSWFLNRHSADLGKNVLSEVGLVVNGVLMPGMTLIANGVIALALLVLLFAAHFKLAVIVGVTLSVAYGLIYIVMSRFLSKIGRDRKKANQQKFTVLAEAFGAAKEIKIGGLEDEYVKRFSSPAESFARQQAIAATITLMPRYALEALAFGGVLLIVLYLMTGSQGLAAGLPTIALYAFAGYRLMPAFQQMYASLTQLRYAVPALNALHADLASLPSVDPSKPNVEGLVLTDAITLNDVCYAYPKANSDVIHDVSLEIRAKSTVAFVGSTGSGKTTIVDLIMGLLEPQAGMIKVDGVPIKHESLRKWQRSIGYVPQQIFLSDDTVAANIALGVAPADIDIVAVERAARIASLHDFVISNLPNGYATTIGERGIRLSGGQRQRIGIARALYHNPQILVLDEATSALDNLTEHAVMDAVDILGHQMTIILIAHRLTTVRKCDQIFLLSYGRIEASGTYDELVRDSEIFRAMQGDNHAN
jgi:ABC-type multidrug transport system fused ATPase/permease subunit